MNNLLDKTKTALSTVDLGALIDDIANVAKVFIDPSKDYL